MKFLVDAQLPKSLCQWLKESGYDAIHTLELPQGNLSSDQEIATRADQEGRIVISKDADFLNDHLINDSPKYLLVIKTGNISNAELKRLFELNFKRLEELFISHRLIEINRENVVVLR